MLRFSKIDTSTNRESGDSAACFCRTDVLFPEVQRGMPALWE